MSDKGKENESPVNLIENRGYFKIYMVKATGEYYAESTIDGQKSALEKDIAPLQKLADEMSEEFKRKRETGPNEFCKLCTEDKCMHKGYPVGDCFVPPMNIFGD